MTTADLQEEQHGETWVVHLGSGYGNFSELRLDGLLNRLMSIVAREDCRNLVIDLAEVDFFATSFIEVLVRVWNRVKNQSGVFVVSGLKPYPLEVFQVARLDTLWPLSSDVDEALQIISKK